MIAAIELALLDVLRDAGDDDVLGYRYAVLETFPDEFDEYLKSVGNLRTPAAWVSWLGMGEGEDLDDDNGWTATCRFVLVVGASNLRNEQQARHGDGVVPGSYQLVVDAIRLLSRSWLEPLQLVAPVTVRAARPIARTEEMKRQHLSLIAIELQCAAPFGSFAPELGGFNALHVDWDVPAFGNVAAPLPAADPDAEDLIEVPQ